MELKVLDTDRFFYDSPNAGEPDCICSRCQQPIREDELPLRVAISHELLTVKDRGGKDMKKKVDAADGMEFRLCTTCQNKIGIVHAGQ